MNRLMETKVETLLSEERWDIDDDEVLRGVVRMLCLLLLNDAQLIKVLQSSPELVYYQKKCMTRYDTGECAVDSPRCSSMLCGVVCGVNRHNLTSGRCGKLSRKQPLFNLYKIFKTHIAKYREDIAAKLPEYVPSSNDLT